MYDVIVVGCGAAGMMAGITLAEKGKKVIILEKNEKPGKKLFITGKGRCNLTNNCDKDELYKNVVSNPKFLFSSFDNFDSYKTMDFFEKELGLNIKTERGNRVFPVSNHSSDVINVLQRKLNKLGVKIRLNCEVKDIITKPVDISDNSSYDNEKYDLFHKWYFIGFFIITTIVIYISTPNQYLMHYKKEELPQYKFAKIINSYPSTNQTLLNYGFLDGGFYTATGIIPNCKAFCLINMSRDELMLIQNQHIQNGLSSFIVTRDSELDDIDRNSLYDKIASSEFYFEEDIHTYYLYKLKSLTN